MSEAETLVMRIPSDLQRQPEVVDWQPDPERQPDPDRLPKRLYDLGTPMNCMLTSLGNLAQLAGEPSSVDVSNVLQEVVVSVPSMIIFTTWCGCLGISQQETIGQEDELGTIVSAQVGDPQTGTWRVRLHCHIGCQK
jgi:hypothetical protein